MTVRGGTSGRPAGREASRGARRGPRGGRDLRGGARRDGAADRETRGRKRRKDGQARRRSPRLPRPETAEAAPVQLQERRPLRLDRFLGLVSLGVVGVLGLSLFLTSPFFGVREIMVIGVEHLSRAEIVELCDIAVGTNILRVPTGRVRDSLESHPRVEAAVVSRRLPDRILVEVVEREGVALLPAGEEYAEVASQGLTIDLHRYIGGLGLPVVTGVEVGGATAGEDLWAEGLGPALVCAAALGPRGRLAVSEIHLDEAGELTLYTREGTPVFLGAATSLDAKVEGFLSVLWELEEGDLEVTYVDLRYPRYPALGTSGQLPEPIDWVLEDPDAAAIGGP